MKTLLSEVSNDLEKQQAKNRDDKTLKEENELKHNDDQNRMSKIILLHQEFY